MSAPVVLVTILGLAALASGIWIESPKVTNWGEWGEEEFCQNGTDITGFRIKVQTDQGVLDDTALNAIELHCGTGAERHIIMSKEGIKGAWGTSYQCPEDTYAVGFQMRTEEATLFDNTGANNIEIFCSDGSVLQGAGMDWGDWTGQLFCPSDMKICGLRVQVEDPIVQPPSKRNVFLQAAPDFSWATLLHGSPKRHTVII
jgi:hypothetical protein